MAEFCGKRRPGSFSWQCSVCVCVCVCARARFLLSSRRHVVLCVPACVYTVVCGTDTARTLMPRAVLHLPVRYGGHSSQGRCYHVSSSVDLSPEEAEGRGGVECRVRVAAPPPPSPAPRHCNTDVRHRGLWGHVV